tara:strand:+ start:2837 stop:4537 length:1701 start_codon:yes stop_codon:yes gene_type:complete
MTDKNWKEDEWNQVKHCACCLEPMLMSDWLKTGSRSSRYSKAWANRTVCAECIRINAYRYIKEEESRQRLDFNHLKLLLSNVREALGLKKADNDSTFDGWETCALIATNVGVGARKGVDSDIILRCNELTELYEYCLSLKRDEGFYDTKLTQHSRMGIAMLISIVNRAFPNEIRDWPLWCLPHQTRVGLESAGLKGIHEIKYPMLFDRMMEEIYVGNPTFDDIKNLCSVYYYRYELKPNYPWMPSFQHITCLWDFAYAFQMHYCNDEPVFKHEDYKLQLNDASGVRGLTLEDCRWWFFNYLCKDYDIQLNQDTFPYDATNDELQQVINLSINDIKTVSASSKIQTRLYDGKTQKGIRSMVEVLWPDYEMDNNLWNRMLVSEKRMSDLLERVITHFGMDYHYNESVYIPTRTGKVARYAHSKKIMRVDGISHLLNLIVEGQGDYHYIDKTNARSRWFDGCNWDSRIPSSYNGKATTGLEYRQEQDAKCRRAIKRHGFSPVYVILSKYARPTRGVHSNIPTWNRKYVTGSHTKTIGLAETFDMQGREDVGDMIRKYHNDVVMRATASS